MKKFLVLLLVAMLALPMGVDAKKKKKKKSRKKKPAPVKYEKITLSVKVDTEYEGEGEDKQKVHVFNLSARNPNKGNAEGLTVELYAILKHKDKSGVYSMESLKVGGKGFNIKGRGKWTGTARTTSESDVLIYSDYVAVLSNGGKELRTSGGSRWKKLLSEIAGMQKGDTFNTKGELLESAGGGEEVAAGEQGAKGKKKAGKKKGGKKKKAKKPADNGGGAQ